MTGNSITMFRPPNCKKRILNIKRFTRNKFGIRRFRSTICQNFTLFRLAMIISRIISQISRRRHYSSMTTGKNPHRITLKGLPNTRRRGRRRRRTMRRPRRQVLRHLRPHHSMLNLTILFNLLNRTLSFMVLNNGNTRRTGATRRFNGRKKRVQRRILTTTEKLRRLITGPTHRRHR